MAEPTSGAVGAGLAGWKAAGGAAGMYAGGAGLAAILVMLATPPRSAREWAIGLIATVMGSVCGGAGAIMYFNLQIWMESFTGLMALLGLVFACGLPAWAVVRWAFTWIIKRQGKDLGEVIQDAKQDFGVGK